MTQSRNASEHREPVDSVREGLRSLLRQGRVHPASVLACPSLLLLAASGRGEFRDDAVAATMAATAIERAIASAPERATLEALFGVGDDTAGTTLGERRAAAAKIAGVTTESFRVRREARLIEQLARAVIVEMAYPNRRQVQLRSDTAQPARSHKRRAHSPSHATRQRLTDRVWEAVTSLQVADNALGIGIWEAQAPRLGEVLNALTGLGGEERHIKDGYQYVGAFPAQLWKQATFDDHYATLSYGIRTFHRRWRPLRRHLTARYHYISIGPGTGEKDQTILQHLQSLAGDDAIAYIPVDISPDLLRNSLSVSMRGIDDQRVAAIPVELDVNSDDGVRGLRTIIDAVRGETPVLVSVLGNTLANFDDDHAVLSRLALLLPDERDRCLLELATTDQVTSQTAALAAVEYQGSPSFIRFAIAALREYTDLDLDAGHVTSSAEISDQTIKITTRFVADESRTVEVKNGDRFALARGETIRLYVSRKYTRTALEALVADFEMIGVAQQSSSASSDFGVAALLVRPR